ncbi:Mog1p/PsbP-like protein [Obba rivulosa]|uniref:Mog1p/PsbP-like protein n=1 Tax=Obba rivulosa TaxID=1052685 RepID=A0A8E2DTQ7_9APHY|nr:Mog1p/PsbP-like protein [Obba rivulosa]
MSATRELFGGAITATLPTKLIDASDLRQVPDTQEVFLYPDSGVSIIVEVLQSVELTNPLDVARFHFDSLAHDNDAEKRVVEEANIIPNGTDHETPKPVVLSGIQSVRKFNKATLDEVHILLAVYRLDDHNIDLVMSMNIPTKTEDGNAVSETEQSASKDAFNTAAQSLRIVDFGLFA